MVHRTFLPTDRSLRVLASERFIAWSCIILLAVAGGPVTCFAEDVAGITADGGQAKLKNLVWSVTHPPGNEKAWDIRLGDHLVTTYHEDLDGTPGFFPLQTPQQLELTRRFPIGAARPFEKEDHDHHRSMWFTHGIVNDLDFWIDDDGPHVGKVVHRQGQFDASSNGVVLDTQNDWIDADGHKVLSDQRRFRFSHDNGDTIIDVTVRLNATNGDVNFGDTKEGTFGLRLAGTMKVDAKKIDPRLGGKVINTEGMEDAAAWSQKSDWVDYSGPVLPKQVTDELKPWSNDPASTEKLLSEPLDQVGITMMYHPGSDLPECRWHVRTYGLFAANPFGRRHFGLEEYDGVNIANGDSLTLNFRLVLHDGVFNESKTKQHYEDFSEAPADRIQD